MRNRVIFTKCKAVKKIKMTDVNMVRRISSKKHFKVDDNKLLQTNNY